MRKQMEDNVSVHFSNGLSIKGSYKHSMRGCYIDLYLMNKEGLVIANKSLGLSVTGKFPDAPALLKIAIDKISQVIKQYKVDEVSDEAVLEQIAPTVILKAFPKAA